MRTEAPVVVEGPPDGDVDAIVAAVHEALGAGGMIRVPNPHAPAVLSRFDEEINRRARAECTTADVIIERALIHYLRSA
ncbi:hypothetical protein [Actinomyces dentalis]|jgi:hypothetical protein|uniref:hypothetical protein n=1 Tax=Actinomyces dentalis TaxID=272548 RepID=UPI00041C0AF5|nr:hypothetical protein [Actinomyces dentalis]